MTNQQRFILAVLTVTAAIVYLFVSAPEDLPEEQAGTPSLGTLVPVETVLRLIARENDVARALYTAQIVGAGQRAGLAFGENWRDESVEAGPLPALFLRETSASIEKSPVELGLFLGSAFPIAASNRFSGVQMEKFERMNQTREPEFFFDDNTLVYTAMFPDLASVQPCVDCHNAHPESPKTDWALNDVMGATTWTYPRQAIPINEALAILRAVRNGFYDAYAAYLQKAHGFAKPPEIGDRWPRDGYFLPNLDVFRAEFESRAAPQSIQTLMDAASPGISSSE